MPTDPDYLQSARGWIRCRGQSRWKGIPTYNVYRRQGGCDGALNILKGDMQNSGTKTDPGPDDLMRNTHQNRMPFQTPSKRAGQSRIGRQIPHTNPRHAARPPLEYASGQQMREQRAYGVLLEHRRGEKNATCASEENLRHGVEISKARSSRYLLNNVAHPSDSVLGAGSGGTVEKKAVGFNQNRQVALREGRTDAGISGDAIASCLGSIISLPDFCIITPKCVGAISATADDKSSAGFDPTSLPLYGTAEEATFWEMSGLLDEDF
ncbi:hypothetical protein B0H11DRAFT_2183253 [Mycena galericulata]|nr:hypothetical protein B0H11DRAFT_2183253 [Mycena galericulata]